MNNLIKKLSLFIENQSINSIGIFTTLIIIVVFSPIFFGHDFLTYDDNLYIYENPNIINFSLDAIIEIITTPHAGQYSPIPEIINGITFTIFEKNALVFKSISLATHILNALLVLIIFNKLFDNKKLVLFITLIFSIHPVQVELIAWICGIYRIATFFMLIGVLCYVKYINTKKRLYFAAVFLCYILALSSKEQALLFPISLIVINLLKGEKIFQKRVVLENIFFGLIGILFALFTLYNANEKHAFSLKIFSAKEKIYLFTEAILNYTRNFFLPTELSFSYLTFIDETPKTGFIVFNILLCLLLAAAIIFVCIKSRKLFYGILWSAGFLSLAILSFTLFSIGPVYMADRYMYFAIIGMAIAFFYGIKLITTSFPKFGIVIKSGVILYVVFLFCLSFQRVSIFKNSKTLWSDTIKVNPNHYMAYNSLGYYYRANHDYKAALENYKKSLYINDEYYLSHNNIGKVYFKKKEYKKALAHISQSIKLRPDYYKGYKNRAAIYKNMNLQDSLIVDLNRLLSVYPDDTSYLKERAVAYFKLKKYKKARIDALKLCNTSPNDSFYNYLVGHCSLLLNDYKLAIQYMNKAIKNGKKNNGKYYYLRSSAKFNNKNYLGALGDALAASKKGFKVNKRYLKTLVLKSKKINVN